MYLAVVAWQSGLGWALELTSPALLTLASTASLTRANALFPHVPFAWSRIAHKNGSEASRAFRISYWRTRTEGAGQGGRSSTARPGKASPASGAKRSGDASVAGGGSPLGTVLGFRSAADPNVQSVALRASDADAKLATATKRLRTKQSSAPQTGAATVEVARALYETALLHKATSKITDELVVKVRSVAKEASTERTVLLGLSQDATALLPVEHRHKVQEKVQQADANFSQVAKELKLVEEEAAAKRKASMRVEDEAVAALHEAAESTRASNAELADELERMAMAILAKRKKKHGVPADKLLDVNSAPAVAGALSSLCDGLPVVFQLCCPGHRRTHVRAHEPAKRPKLPLSRTTQCQS